MARTLIRGCANEIVYKNMSKNDNHIKNQLWVNRSDEMRKWCMQRTLSLRGDVCVAQKTWAVKLVLILTPVPVPGIWDTLKPEWLTKAGFAFARSRMQPLFYVMFVSSGVSCNGPCGVPGCSGVWRKWTGAGRRSLQMWDRHFTGVMCWEKPWVGVSAQRLFSQPVTHWFLLAFFVVSQSD